MESFSIFFYPEDIIRLNILFLIATCVLACKSMRQTFIFFLTKKSHLLILFLILKPFQYLIVMTNSEGALTSWISVIFLAISEDNLLILQT